VDIYAQRIDASGVVQWTTNGVAVCTAVDFQTSPAIATDGSGGAIVAWVDERTGSYLQIYAQRINASGVVQWTTDGVYLSTGVIDSYSQAIISDGAGGAIVTWYDDLSGSNDIYAQRITASGAAQWTAGGEALCAAANDQGVPAIASDGAGGAIVAWHDYRSGTHSDVYVQRITASGAAQWTADGVALCAAANDQGLPAIASDGAGGAVVTWYDYRSGTHSGVYAQRITASGVAQWTADGVVLCAAANDQLPTAFGQRFPPIVSDGAGGAIVAWHDNRSGIAYDIYAQRVSAAGDPLALTVTTTAEDFVPGTLWYAITQANTLPGLQVVGFNIPGSGPHVINANCLPLPAITDELTIDGFTQPGASPNSNPLGSPSNAQIKIEISGPHWSFWPGVPGLRFLNAGTLRGVAISGFDACVEVQSLGVVVEGCYIGTNASGLQLGPHQQKYGVRVLSNTCRVGGASPAARNVIANCQETGIVLDDAWLAQIYGNYVGVGADGTTVIPNWLGLRILNGTEDARVGSSLVTPYPSPSEANVIHWNTYGIFVEGTTSVRNFIAGNSMLGNSVSIDLGGDGSTGNDPSDVDSGPNQLQNYPDLTSALGDQVSGTMTGAPFASLFLHFYQSAFGITNARDFIGGTIVELDASGSATFSFVLPQPIAPGGLINATASDLDGNTSEISWPAVYQNTPPGPGMSVPLVDANGDTRGTVTFDDVTGAGNTVLTTPFTPPTPLTGGFYAGDPNDPTIYFDVTTDASYTGSVEVCFFYDDSNLPGPESDLELVHYNGSAWVAVTSSQDEVSNVICGMVTTLSPFVIAVSTAVAVDEPLPSEFALHANVPNPFNPVTTIRYEIPVSGADVSITIYDVAGRLVRELVNGHRDAGTWSAQWNGDDDRGRRVASGVYFYRMRAGSFVETKKMVLLK
jgi:hypothetical protein